MCDYSLAHYPNRMAVEGEQLLVCRFSSGTLGLTSCSDLKEILYPVRTTAVCIPPGARLRLRDIPEHLQQSLAVRAVEGSHLYRTACRIVYASRCRALCQRSGDPVAISPVRPEG